MTYFVVRFQHIWNGAVDAGTTLASAAVALLASRLHADVFKTKSRLLSLLVVASSFLSCSILLMTNTGSRYWSYVGYSLLYICYTFTVTIARYFRICFGFTFKQIFTFSIAARK